MLDEEIIRFWGADSLVRWPADLVAKTGLSEDAKAFLTRVGLPRGADWTARFDLTLDEMRRSVTDPRYLVVGYDTGFPFCVDMHGGGRVICNGAVDKEQFVNSDVRRFGECLLLFQKYRLTVRKMIREEEIQQLISETEGAMRASDSAAFSGTENCWALVVEQMKDGSL
jgi:hypothetical protein